MSNSKEKTGNGEGCLWVCIHGMALLFFLPALFITVPLHLIASAVGNKK